ncbi:hypothetical protein GGI64_004412 [Rhizobium leguminosarum]|uniref:Uncharacterized protein n=1 Tax=Rhizobium leguminosarum TaxID=384 RepID=A0A7Z0E1H0_RHILE|nr:hypothetical protein [Rhizobium leguminosarum]MBB6219883.1 hypothetical protein [Rhizobium leguminosarum]NYJ13331.1 hypothetical protein [Rhizobium leguminosarum]
MNETINARRHRITTNNIAWAPKNSGVHSQFSTICAAQIKPLGPLNPLATHVRHAATAIST